MKQILILTVLFPIALNAQSTDDIVEAYFQAVGGKDRWINLQTRIDHTHTLVYDKLYGQLIPDKGKIGVKYAKRKAGNTVWDRFTSLSVTNLEDSFVTCYNGEKYWARRNDDEPTVYEGFTNRYGQFANIGEPDCILKADSLDFIGIDTVNNAVCYVLEVAEGGNLTHYYFDTQTYLLVQSHRKGYTRITKYSDYREVEGIKIPFLEESYDGKKLEYQFRRQKVEVNIPIDDQVFSFP